LPINELKRVTTFGGCADLNLHRCKHFLKACRKDSKYFIKV